MYALQGYIWKNELSKMMLCLLSKEKSLIRKIIDNAAISSENNKKYFSIKSNQVKTDSLSNFSKVSKEQRLKLF